MKKYLRTARRLVLKLGNFLDKGGERGDSNLITSLHIHTYEKKREKGGLVNISSK